MPLETEEKMNEWVAYALVGGSLICVVVEIFRFVMAVVEDRSSINIMVLIVIALLFILLSLILGSTMLLGTSQLLMGG